METDANKENALIELKHIQLEMQSGRFKHLRHFVDPYYCYANDIVRKSGAINTDDVLWTTNVSKAARELEEEIGDYTVLRKRIRKEHVVPLRFITKKLSELVENGRLGIHDIESCLDTYLKFATITIEEDNRLNNLGLNSKMPEGFYELSDPLYQDLYARYKLANIELI